VDFRAAPAIRGVDFAAGCSDFLAMRRWGVERAAQGFRGAR
jgi:hypothetical protein